MEAREIVFLKMNQNFDCVESDKLATERSKSDAELTLSKCLERVIEGGLHFQSFSNATFLNMLVNR